jgi:EmrB/QacA subfamily drug resistance transporter
MESVTGSAAQLAPSGGPDSATDKQAERYAWRVLSVTTLGVLLAGTNTSTLDVALPVVARHFSATATQASWILLTYMLVNSILILVFGRIADLVGRRRLYLLGLSTLTVASLLCGLAPNAEVLAGFRGLQAVGAAAIITNTTALLTDAFPSRLLSSGLGFNVSAAAAAQVAGPVVGGAFASGFGWRAVFWFNVPFGVAGLIWALISLRADPHREAREPFDFVGASLSAFVVGGLVLALSEGGALGWSSIPVLIGIVMFVVSLPLFIVSQLRRRYPMLDLHLFASRERSGAYAGAFLLAVARFAVVLLMALYLQAAMGLGAFAAGIRVIPVAAGISLASPLAGRLARRYPTRLVASAGLALTTAGLAGLALAVSPDRDYVWLGVCMAAVGVGCGIFMTPNTTSIMAGVDSAHRGMANGARSMLQNTGFVVSTAMSLAIVTSPLNPLEKQAAYAGTLSQLSGSALNEFTGGYRIAFWVLAASCLVAFVASISRGSPTPAEPAQDVDPAPAAVTNEALEH